MGFKVLEISGFHHGVVGGLRSSAILCSVSW